VTAFASLLTAWDGEQVAVRYAADRLVEPLSA